ncbi:helicase C-terminal domain-containing protein [Eggerthellaceae bacterium 3-80]|nr:DNA polymerase III subunit epsilon [bacterium D16-34]
MNNSSEILAQYILEGTPDDVIDRYNQLSDIAKRAKFDVLDSNIVVIDTETTGFSFHHDELTQIAAARMEDGEIVEWFNTFVNPGKPIPDDVQYLTNIHDDDVKDAPSPDEALADLVAFVGDAKIIAHNAEFDKTFTTKHPSGYPLLTNQWIDSLDLARIALPRLKSHRLIDLVKAFGAPISTHRADDDVAATCAIYRILLAGVASMPSALVCEIANLTTVDLWPTQIVFEYFAQKYTAQHEKEVEQQEASTIKDDAITFTDTNFSLRTMRKERITNSIGKPKIDADDIAADPDRALHFPQPADIEAAFSQAGLVGSLYSDFEPRVEQLEMAQAVRTAFASSENLMVEAGTGVGKSMAYLVPAVLTSLNNNIGIGVATKTNALLDQLVYHELPALRQALALQNPQFKKIEFAALKGFSHYPCLRKINRIGHDGIGIREVAGKEVSQAPAYAALLSYIEQSEYDDLDSLKIDYRVLPRRSITTTSKECFRRKCPFYGNICFVHGSRHKAEAANIVVTNHSLFFCDQAADGGLLPPLRYWILDEAHGAENEARRAFSVDLNAEEIMRLVGQIGESENSRNVFQRTERKVEQNLIGENCTLFHSLNSKAKAAAIQYSQVAREFCSHLKDLLYFDSNKRNKSYDTIELWINSEIRSSETFQKLVELGVELEKRAEKVVLTCQDLVGFLEDIDGATEVQRELALVAIELKEQINAVNIILTNPEDTYAYSAKLNKKKDRQTDVLEGLLLNVGEKLNDKLFSHTHSVVLASATLTVNKSFKPFEVALGLNSGEYSVASSCLVKSSYDFDNQMTVYVVQDMPEPNSPQYLSALQELLVEVHKAQQGSMLTLFTNRKEMEACYDVVQPQLKTDDLRLVCQKWGVSVKGLRDDFVKDEHLSLFALKSFWEGFDAPGATLRGVVIPKLPFSKPSDPLSCERAAHDDQAWRHYVLPAAVLETKQAAGRLIRKSTDTGILILADNRLVTKGYGKTFLNSLPSQNIKVLPAQEIIAEIASTFSKTQGNS